MSKAYRTNMKYTRANADDVLEDTVTEEVIEQFKETKETKEPKKKKQVKKTVVKDTIDLKETGTPTDLSHKHVECQCDECVESRESNAILLTEETVYETCREFMEKNNLIELLNLSSWKLRLTVGDTIDEDGIYLGLCEFDHAYSIANIKIAVQGHDSLDDVKDTLMHELCHVVLAEIDNSARALLSTVPEHMQAYVDYQLHTAREHAVINLSNIFRRMLD